MPRRRPRPAYYYMPLNPTVIAMCQRCGDCFRWLPDNFDMRHRFNRETHEYCGGQVVRQEPEMAKALQFLQQAPGA